MECVSDKYRSITANCYWLVNVVGAVMSVWSAYMIRDDVYLQLVNTVAQLLFYLFWL